MPSPARTASSAAGPTVLPSIFATFSQRRWASQIKKLWLCPGRTPLVAPSKSVAALVLLATQTVQPPNTQKANALLAKTVHLVLAWLGEPLGQRIGLISTTATTQSIRRPWQTAIFFGFQRTRRSTLTLVSSQLLTSMQPTRLLSLLIMPKHTRSCLSWGASGSRRKASPFD